MDTFLSPVEKPQGFMMKMVYYFTRKQFGKVLTPLTVYGARMPLPFGMFTQKINKLDQKLAMDKQTALMIRQHVSQLNTCLFCIDIGRWATINKSMSVAKFDELKHYKTSAVFTDAERAVLDYVTELTKDKKVNKATFDRMAKFYSEREICDVVWLVASEHVYNMTNIGLNIHSDMLCKV